MKNTLLTALFCCLFSTHFLFAQTLTDAIPTDPSVRKGVLPNGMTYFVKKNGKPEKRCELRLALNAGSMLESDDQQGLAHFVEHMCFNGTKNFKKSALIDFLESAGVKFGAHLNAYTSFDETVYMLQLPTDKEDLFLERLSSARRLGAQCQLRCRRNRERARRSHLRTARTIGRGRTDATTIWAHVL